MNRVFSVVVATGTVLLCLGGLAQAITIETVRVADAGNVADTAAHSGTAAGQGSVAYDYNIGKYEVTAAQYTAFLNAVAKTDKYGLYNPKMWSDTYGCKIYQNGVSGNYNYRVGSDYENRPVNFVSYWDSCRFANWLSNGQKTGAQDNTTTEAGAYTLNGYKGTDGGTIGRNTGATWAVASGDEWYKAAYYDPNKDGAGVAGYWLYPTRSNTAPGRDMADASGNNANLYDGHAPYPIDSGRYYYTVGGEFQNSGSPYGTFDQGGNVQEWTEGVAYQTSGYAYRAVRGGTFDVDYYSLQSSSRPTGFPDSEAYFRGFRVSEVPEPSSIIALLGGLAGLLGLRRRRR